MSNWTLAYEGAQLKKIIINYRDMAFDIYLGRLEEPVLYLPFVKKTILCRLIG